MHDGTVSKPNLWVRKRVPHERDTCKSIGKTVRFVLRTVLESGPARLCLPDSALSGLQLYLALAAHGLPMGGITD